ncbi:hypothetical protein K3759_11095 [Sulfitobacter sp. W027]|uniref:hypothetical protein n=1 Tax=Sulfitobacter sp. W027 TaxID=2867025 RepID=UPI0021A71EC1|nr:hypothetical protein [Sulfitobacter sp. W027]UWR32503.1 hypothetical protein K3759_11095 [Sulfitobacter sp. W027]
MKPPLDKLVTIDGIEFTVIDHPSGERWLAPHDSEKQKKHFPVEWPLLQSYLTASRGISAHILDPFSDRENKELGLPSNRSTSGFSAAHLNLTGDWNFYPECMDVLDANDWLAEPYGPLSKQILETVCREDGEGILTKSQDVFGDGWEHYIAERASIYVTEPFTRVWYAANMLSAYFARNDELLFGYLWCEYRLKMRMERNARTGSKVIAGTKLAAHQTNIAHSSLREARFRMMERLVPTIGPDKAAIECELRGLGSAQAVKRQWNRFQSKKRDT